MLSLCTPQIFVAVCWDVQGGHLGLKLFPGWTATIDVQSRHSPFLHWHRSGPRRRRSIVPTQNFPRLFVLDGCVPWSQLIDVTSPNWTFGYHTNADTPSPVFLDHNIWNPTWVFIPSGSKVKGETRITNLVGVNPLYHFILRLHGLFRL